jgi:hypothetical protein
MKSGYCHVFDPNDKQVEFTTTTTATGPSAKWYLVRYPNWINNFKFIGPDPQMPNTAPNIDRLM